jgi:hypothetical protein
VSKSFLHYRGVILTGLDPMGKHETGYARVERDLYPTREPWVTDALAEYVDFRGLTVWEFACGNGDMAEALRQQGCARVYTSDIEDRGNRQDEVLDFLSGRMPKLPSFDALCTNPPYGQGGRLAVAFIEAGLAWTEKRGGLLALLLPCDFDSAKTRARFFRDCPHFLAKIVLTRRIVWFERNDGIREAPKENSAWFIWQRNLLRVHRSPMVLYAPSDQPCPEARS